ncbi:N-6 DNA methylase [Dyadobacter sp. LJ53]|uniref:Eco57I restriction-modification methylase domain-containing protein n=1 Tax=Dyadobacter chenwenxiniae TaxID=2906456 RepID=UPI001F1EE7EB|nr:N-6 DNA methylase [Dyadobacter chenwenxiniae]MCF0050619.1 N-6 DNA methylase [Dyadobacter chenwenxiniae]
MQFSIHDVIVGLTTESPTLVDKPTLLNKFATSLGWNPSYHLEPTKEIEDASIHLIVEHGLENTAIISFLKAPYTELSEDSRNRLLNISYNNLVDWHIHVEKDKVTYVYNRINSSKNVVAEFSFRKDQYENLRSEAFDKVMGRRPSPNIPALDDSLIQTISYWKRAISSEINDENINEGLSTLFNIIIFIRAIEDNLKKYLPDVTPRILPSAWHELKDQPETGLEQIVKLAFAKLGDFEIPEYLIDYQSLSSLKNLSKQTVSYLLGDFYDNKHTSLYHYDFSVMSMHALSRIYERYIAILKVEDDSQLSLFPAFKHLASEQINKAYGSIYTPQYIARFFVQYLRENISPSDFRNTKIAEPAVGSGIFLRSLLEIKCDPRNEYLTEDQIPAAFQDLLGLDIDPNATKATQLSLSLLQLVLTGKLPEKLNIITAETIDYVSQRPDLNGSFDVVISNPPFISTSAQTDFMREKITNFMQDLGSGRIDTYLAFLKIGVDLLKPGGFGFFVLPHSFTVAESAAKLRKFISGTCWIRCFADLSAIEVFGETGIYVVLLVIQKKSEKVFMSPTATIVKCKDFVGKALQAALKNNFTENDFYSVYEIDQSNFHRANWFVLPPKEIRIQNKLSRLSKLSDFVEVRQGVVTGADDVFIVKKELIPANEESIYVPYVPDRQIDSYKFNKNTESYLIYPFLNGEKLEEQDMIQKFPQTWLYLNRHKKRLLSSKSFREESWWRPLRTRKPQEILRGKIITPHLTITPKFAIDIEGRFVVSRSPYMIPKLNEVEGTDILLYLLAVLNSTACYWYISNHSHIYSRGYSMLEVKTLNQTPIPDPKTVSPVIMRKLITLVLQRIELHGAASHQIDLELDEIVSGLYNLNSDDREALGLIN